MLLPLRQCLFTWLNLTLLFFSVHKNHCLRENFLGFPVLGAWISSEVICAILAHTTLLFACKPFTRLWQVVHFSSSWDPHRCFIMVWWTDRGPLPELVSCSSRKPKTWGNTHSSTENLGRAPESKENSKSDRRRRADLRDSYLPFTFALTYFNEILPVLNSLLSPPSKHPPNTWHTVGLNMCLIIDWLPSSGSVWPKRQSLSQEFYRDFPGGPVVQTPCFHCKERRFDPWSGN